VNETKIAKAQLMRAINSTQAPLGILHLEDNANDAELVRLTLEESGIACRVTRAANQAEFTAALQQGQLDLVLADFSLPGFDGLAALQLTRRFTAAPFILVSGTIGEELAVESLKNGATDYVLKERLFRLVPAVQRAMQEVEHQRARQQAEQAREASKRKLQVLSRRLVETQETERRHIARELHDEIGQTLTVAQLNLQAILAQPETATIQPRLQECLVAVERVLEQVHDISLNLRPSMLDDLGLAPALRWYTHRQADLVGLQAEFAAEALSRRLHPRLETECFRIAQEALTNVVRHARAKSVKVTLKQRSDRLELRVRDDGVGFDLAVGRERAVRGASLGLLSMEERAALLGGELEIKSAPGQGTEIRAWLPLRWHDENSTSNLHD
jgi:signal transduction histidine kinase